MGLFGGNDFKKLLKEAQAREDAAQRNAQMVTLRCPRCGSVSTRRIAHRTDQYRCTCGYILTIADRY